LRQSWIVLFLGGGGGFGLGGGGGGGVGFCFLGVLWGVESILRKGLFKKKPQKKGIKRFWATESVLSSFAKWGLLKLYQKGIDRKKNKGSESAVTECGR